MVVDKGWSVEIALDWKSMAPQAIGVSCPQKHGDQWRVNMSRVHRDREDTFTHDWTWSCQALGSMHVPAMYRYSGTDDGLGELALWTSSWQSEILKATPGSVDPWARLRD